MATRNTHKWDAQTHEDLLLEIFQHVNISQPDLQKVLSGLQSRGYNFTANAFRRGWDQTSHEALLFAFIDEYKPGKAPLTNITERMKSMGYAYSYDAINQHIQKLRKNRDKAAANGGTSAATPSKSTPSKKAATPRKNAIPKPVKVKKDPSASEDEEIFCKNLIKKEEAASDEELDSPSKRPAKRAKKAPSPPAGEHDSETEV